MPNADLMFQVGTLHGIDLNVSSPELALRELESLVRLRQSHFVCFFEGNLFYRSLCDETIRKTINRATLIYPDGIAVAKALSWQLQQPVQRVSGPSFLLQACAYGIERNWRHFFLGGGDGVAERLAAKLRQKYPALQIAGTCCPPFRPLTAMEEQEVRRQIEASRWSQARVLDECSSGKNRSSGHAGRGSCIRFSFREPPLGAAADPPDGNGMAFPGPLRGEQYDAP